MTPSERQGRAAARRRAAETAAAAAEPAPGRSSTAYPADAPWLRREALAETLAALVRIDSVNPAYGGPPDGEARLNRWVAEWLRQFGLEPVLEDALPGRPNLRVRLEGESDAAPLLLQTHVDTVSVEAMTIDPFGAAIEGDRLFGRGATDAKAQVAALLHAVAAWASSGARPPRPVELALCVDEEAGFGGARALVNTGLRPCAVLVAEPTELAVVAAHKGVARWWIRVEGVAAHAARPGAGVHAIHHAAMLIERIRLRLMPELAQRHAPLLDPPTINVGLIAGGIQANMIPPLCRFHVERRLLPGETPEQARRELQALIDDLASNVKDFRATQEAVQLAAPPLATDPHLPWVRLACAVAHDHGAPPAPQGVDYATDGSTLAACGAPVIVCGPGSIAQAHTADEFVRLDDVAAGAHLFADLIGRCGKLP